MANIIQLKDIDGNQFYPQSHTKAVIDSNGTTVDTLLANTNDAISNESSRATQAESTLQNNINAEISRAQAAESNLQQLYQSLTQSDIEVVNSVPSSGVANKIYRVVGTNSYSDYMFNSSDLNTAVKMAEYNNAIDDEPTAGSNNLVKSGGVANTYGNYENNPEWIKVITDSERRILCGIKNDGSIEWSLGVPTPVKESIATKVDKIEGKGLSANDFTDIDKEIVEINEIIDQPEFVRVYLDSNDKVLWGIKADGDVVFGAGVPSQITNYVQTEIKKIEVSDVSDIADFVHSAMSSDKTLQQLLNEKADTASLSAVAESGSFDDLLNKPTIPTVPNNVSSFYNDAGYLTNQDIEGKADKSTTYTKTEVDDIISEVQAGQGSDLQNYYSKTQIDSQMSTKANIADLEAKVDKETGKSLIDKDIADNNYVFDDPENRSEIKTDSDGKILSYRDSTGILHECIGINAENISFNRVSLSDEATSDLMQALDKLGYTANNPSDWSDSKYVELPIPSVCAVVNIETDSQAESKGLDIPTHIQYWDKAGNYFRKPIELNAQGSSSMGYKIKNQAIDLTDDSKIKFGHWLAFDSFHIKKFFIDVFRGQCDVCYKLAEQVYNTRPVGSRRPWSYLNSNNSSSSGIGDFSKDFNLEAMAHPDGFPVHVFFNGNDAGIYAFNIKKDRSNYNCKKTNQKNIILDGVLGTTFWNANGDLSQNGESGGNIWHDFEIRNPKIDKDIDGNKYDGDNPKEPSNDWSTCKSYIERLTGAVTAINAEQSNKKAVFEEYFNVPFFIDYDLISQVTFNYDGYRKNWIWLTNDGNKWSPTLYDMDSVFGQHWNGASYVSSSTTQILGRDSNLPSSFLHTLYKSECDLRYKELRDNNIFSVDNICGILERWIKTCGYDNLKNDIENIVTSPYIENGVTMDPVPNTPSYRDGTKTYLYAPTTGGWYNSIERVRNWLNDRFATLDVYYNYNV